MATDVISEHVPPPEQFELLRQFLRRGPEEQGFVRAYLECSDEVQHVVGRMLQVLDDPSSSEEQRKMVISTIADALFRNPHKGEYGMDLAASKEEAAMVEPRLQAIVKRMDEEEDSFALRLRKLMDDQCITQAELAKRIGVGQPAISNMLNRNCRRAVLGCPFGPSAIMAAESPPEGVSSDTEHRSVRRWPSSHAANLPSRDRAPRFQSRPRLRRLIVTRASPAPSQERSDEKASGECDLLCCLQACGPMDQAGQPKVFGHAVSEP